MQLPRVTPKAHPPRTGHTVNLVEQVQGFNDDVSKKMREVVWRFCLPVVLKAICVAGACEIGIYMVYVLPSERVRPNVSKTSAKAAIIRSNPRGDRDTIQASLV